MRFRVCHQGFERSESVKHPRMPKYIVFLQNNIATVSVYCLYEGEDVLS
jgi:hypothetical protein